jgi:hypothetical protein
MCPNQVPNHSLYKTIFGIYWNISLWEITGVPEENLHCFNFKLIGIQLSQKYKENFNFFRAKAFSQGVSQK